MIRLISLSLKNFKGIRKFELRLDGQNANVYGDNATGKTTLYDAFLWLLFDKDSLNRSNFGIKTLDEDGEVINGLDHEVEVILDVDGRELSLRKVYYEKWTKQRGSSKKVFSGHTTDYFVDEVPAKKKEYTEKIAELVDENIFRLLTDPRFFNEQLHWEDRRKLLLEVCGDISDADVIASDKKLAKLSKVLEGRTIEDHKKVIAAKRKEINQQLERIPIRIDEVYNGMPDIEGLDFEGIQKEIDELVSIQDMHRKTLSRVESGGEIAQKEKELAELETDLIKLKAEHNKKKQKAVKGLQDEADDLLKRRNQIGRKLMMKTDEAHGLERKIETTEGNIEWLRKRWHEVNNENFEIHQDCTCPTCGQDIPQEQLDEAKDKAFRAFNLDKSEKLEKINEDGKKLAVELADLKINYNSITDECEELERELNEIEKSTERVYQRIETINISYGEVGSNPEYQDKSKEIDRLKGEIASISAGNDDEIDAIKTSIDEVGAEIRELQGDLVKKEQHEKSQARIAELEAEEKTLAKELDELDEQLYLVEEFTKTKVNLLESSINSKFKMARFKLFETQVNGGLKECCETVFAGVPYSDLNNAARINIGLDIINTLSEHYSFCAPIFVDNRESVTRLMDVNAQVISLVVSESDKKLRVELEENEIKEAV